MSYASRLEKIGLVVALIAIFIVAAHAEVITAEFEAGGVDASATATTAPRFIGHRRQHAGRVPHDAGPDAVVRNEEEFDRRFGMCRRC